MKFVCLPAFPHNLLAYSAPFPFQHQTQDLTFGSQQNPEEVEWSPELLGTDGGQECFDCAKSWPQGHFAVRSQSMREQGAKRKPQFVI